MAIDKRSLARRLIGLAWDYKVRALIALCWAIVAQVFMLGAVVFSGLALDVLRGYRSPDAPPVEWPFGVGPPESWGLLPEVALAAGLVLAFTLARAVVGYFARVSDESLVQSIIVDLRVRLYEKLQRMGFRYFDTQDSGGLINRVTADAQSVRQFIQGVILRLIVAGATLALFIGYMLREHVGLTLATLSVIPLQALVIRSYNRKIRPLFKDMRESMDRLIQSMQEAIIGAKVVRGFGQEGQMVARFAERNDEASAKRMDIAQAASTHLPAIPACAFFQLAILLAYGGYLVQLGPAAGGIALGTIWIFVALLQQLARQVDQIVQTASSIPEAFTGAERVFELLDAPVDIADAPNARAPQSIEGRIEFDRVSMRYGPNGPLVLEAIDFEIKPGETVAIVGPAGSGKSTLLRLIPRFYEIASGSIRVDGVDVREWPLEALRRAIGEVSQEPFLFSNTIRANVAFGLEGVSDARIRQALDDAAALEFVAELPHGLDTIIGERGLTLSGGERQRLTLARAFLLEPRILLLDDATASVDARTETTIQKALDRIMQGRTTLIVAHRLSTLRRADRIVVIERGRVAAIGTHDELVRSNAHYRRSAELQLERELAEQEFADESPSGDRPGPDGARDTGGPVAPPLNDDADPLTNGGAS